jgi:hypothetical protein
MRYKGSSYCIFWGSSKGAALSSERVRKIFRTIAQIDLRLISSYDWASSRHEEHIAMYSLTDIIESVEKFAYEIMIWVLLIPKTIINIILNPTWVPEYIARELEDKTDDRFDSYISPLVLILVSTLVPTAYLVTAPLPGATISGPLEAYVHQPVRLVVDTAFVQQTGNYHYEWTADEQGIKILDYHGLSSYVILTWETPGEKKIHVKVDNGKGEVRETTFTVQIFDENAPLTASSDDANSLNKRGARTDFLTSLQEPRGLFIMFLFLTLPMLFALGIDRLRGVAFSRSSFMHSFYIQCYFFSPVILAFWFLLLGFAFFLDINKQLLLLLLPFTVVLILLVWLFINETRLVMRAKKLNLVLSLLYTSACFALMLLLGYLYFQFAKNSDLLRQALWIFYTVAVVGIIGAAISRPLIRIIKRLF